MFSLAFEIAKSVPKHHKMEIISVALHTEYAIAYPFEDKVL